MGTKRRWFRFSLRTLLAVVTLIAVGVGLFAAQWNRAKRQTAVLRAMGQFDEAYYDYEVFMDGRLNYPEKFPWNAKSPYPQFLQQWLSTDFFHPVVSVRFKDHTYNNERRLRVLERMRSDLPSLRQVAISDYVTSKDLEQIVQIPSLQSLDFTFANFEPDDLPLLARATQLESLDIWMHPPTDEQLQALASLKNLRRLAIRGVRHGDKPAGALAGPWLASFKNLEELDAEFTPLDSRAAEHLAGLNKLRRLVLAKTEMDDAALVHLGKLTGLEDLDLSETKITDSGLQHLSRLTNLKRLRLDQTAITSQSLPHLAGMTSLEELNLNETNIGNDHMGLMAKLSRLTTLSLDKTQVGDEGLLQLGKCSSLQRLGLAGTNVSDHVWKRMTWPPKLHSLSLQETCVTAAALDDLLTCPTLLYLEVEESQFDAQDDARFQAARPRGRLTIGYHRQFGRKDGLPIGDY